MTLALRSASWRVVNGAATACSKERTVTPSRGSVPVILEGPWKAEDVLGDVGEDQVRRDWGDLEEPGLAELALDVVLGVVAVAAVGLHRDVPRLPGRLRGQHQGHVRLGPGRFASLEELRCPEAHEVRGLHARVCLRYGELDPLILSYGTVEHDPLPSPLRGLVDEPAAVSDALGGDEDALGVHAVQDVAEALALLADQGARRYRQVLEDELVGLVVDHDPPGLYREAVAYRLAQLEDKDREPLGLAVHLVSGRRPRQKDHGVRMLDAGDVDLAPVDDVMVSVTLGPGL